MTQPPQRTITTQRTVTVQPSASPPPPPAPTPIGAPSPGARLAAQRLADLLASVRDIPSLNPLAGVVSGPGNQGSANTANMQGHAGTPATFLGCPRTIGGPGIGGASPT